MSAFEQLYLIGSVLGGAAPIKNIISKCSINWQVLGELSIVDINKGFNPIELTNELDCNRVFEGNLGFAGGQIIVSKMEEYFDPVKDKLQYALLWVRLPLPLWSFKANLLWKKFLALLDKFTKFNSEAILKGLFARVCMQVDISSR